ncbi:MAG: ROK family protein [Clostridia bacterium]|nr:ROK family protein [Clostridia bacterium]
MNNSGDVKEFNISSVLQCIQKNGAISKGNIATQLGITTVTSHKLVGELCSIGACCESGEYVSYGGKKAALYKINSNFGGLVGVSVRRNACQVYLCDFELNPIDFLEFSIKLEKLEETKKAIIKRVDKIINKNSDKIRVLGIGISIPGRADKNGTVLDIPAFPVWNGVPLAEIFSQKFNLPTYVDNDANALALSLKWHGKARQLSSFVCLMVEEGIGVGAILNNEVFAGSGFHGSEFGHITVSPEGEQCSCGRRGCLQTYVDENRLLEKLREKISNRRTLNQAVMLYNSGNDSVRGEFDQYIKYLRLTVDNVITVFDPEKVFLYNAVANSVEGFGALVQQPYFDSVSCASRKRPSVELINENDLVYSASACVLFEQIMKKPLSFG